MASKLSAPHEQLVVSGSAGQAVIIPNHMQTVKALIVELEAKAVRSCAQTRELM